ncbi:UbiA prenyltransferase family [Hysterangium stoloniferum]|nr:UbiA prenyltransferase family [Hysterangium stoloniferum]
MAAYKLRTAPYDLAVQLLSFLLGATLIHSAACVASDICDLDFDRQVARTKNRPLVSGRVSMSGAYIWTIIQTLGAIFCLSYTNYYAFRVGLLGVFPIHVLYPLMKRWTYWPQAWLGLGMNWGLPVAWVYAFREPLDIAIPTILFFGTICWSIFYDTIYACQDKVDDVNAGVKSTALLFGTWIRPILALFSVIFIGTLAASGYLNGNGVVYFLLTVGGASLHFIWQLMTLDIDEPNDCWKKFQANHTIGYIIWAGMLVDYYLLLQSP